MSSLRLAILALAAALSTGCATVVHGGWNQRVPVSAPAGAQVTIEPGGQTITAPAVVSLKRNRTHTLKSGAETVTLKPRLSAVMLGNVIFGGLVGIVIDAAFGGGWTLTPDVVAFKEPDAPNIGDANHAESR